MKKIFISLIGIICFSFSHAQVYHPFPDSAAKWSELSGYANFYMGGWTQQAGGWFYATANDSTIDSVQYHLIGFQGTFNYWLFNGVVQVASNSPILPPGQIVGAYREDSSKKIWFRCLDSLIWQYDCSEIPHLLNTDILIYDFNIQIGDTLSWKPHYPICVSTDSVGLTDGTSRKIYRFGDGQQLGENWIEGIGSDLGFLGAYTIPPFESGCNLSCFTQNNIVEYPAGGGFCDSTSYHVGIDEIKNSESLILYPNPSSNTINISSTNLSGKYSLKIYNLLGQQVKQQEIDFSFEGSSKINIESLASGYYQLMLVNGSNVLSKRFVIADSGGKE